MHSSILILIGSINSIKYIIHEKISKKHFEGDDGITEAVGMMDALKFPIIGGFILVSLYILVKYFGNVAVNIFLVSYFIIIGMESFKGIINNYTSIGKQSSKDPNSIKYPFIGNPENTLFGIHLSLSKFDLLCIM